MRKQATCFFIFLAMLLAGPSAFAQSKKLDSLLTVMKGEKNDSEKVKTCYSLSRAYTHEGDYISSVQYALLSAQLADSLHYAIGSARGAIAGGIANYHLGNFAEAMRLDLDALKKYTAMGYVMGIGDAENTVGNVYYDQKMYKESLEHYLNALECFRKNGNKIRLAGSLNNVANSYNGMGDYRKALKIYDSILIVQEQIKNEYGKSDCYMSIGQSYSGLKMYDSSLFYYREALPYYESTQDHERMAFTYGCFGEAYARLGRFTDAKKFLVKGEGLSNKIENKITTKEIYFTLAMVDSALGNYTAAAYDYRLFVTYRDSLQNDDAIKAQTQVELQYEFGKQVAADSIKKVEKKRRDDLEHDQKIRQQQLYTLCGVSGCFLMLIVVIISIRAFRQKQKINLLIAHQKEIVEQKQKEVLDSIHYAKRIQKSLLPTDRYIQKHLADKKHG